MRGLSLALAWWPLTAFRIFGVWALKNLYLSGHAHLMACHVAKFHGGSAFTLKATDNFKPIFEPH